LTKEGRPKRGGRTIQGIAEEKLTGVNKQKRMRRKEGKGKGFSEKGRGKGRKENLLTKGVGTPCPGEKGEKSVPSKFQGLKRGDGGQRRALRLLSKGGKRKASRQW